MRITILTLGSHGDVQPYVALGLGLQTAGHKVRLATHALFETLVCSRGLTFFPVEGNPRDLLETEAGEDWLDSGNKALFNFHKFFPLVEPVIRQSMIDCWHACQDTDAVISSHFGACAAYSVAEKLGVPACIACLEPLTPTSAFASPFFPTTLNWLPFGRNHYNWLTHIVCLQIFWQLVRASTNKARQEILNLPPLSSQWLPRQMRQQRLFFLYGYSPSVLPQPPDWSQSNHVTGYWFLDRLSDWQPPTDLVDFLAAGPPPVSIGFGSMHNRNPEEATEIVLKALLHSKQRGILLTGWGGISNADLPDEVFKIDWVPHDWLFPQMAAVVHHAGAGTTAAQLRAGIPSVTVPFFGDQPFWGQRLFELGTAPKPIPRNRLSEDRLAAAIHSAVSHEGMHAHAKALGERIRAEDGVAKAIELFHRHLRLLI